MAKSKLDLLKERVKDEDPSQGLMSDIALYFKKDPNAVLDFFQKNFRTTISQQWADHPDFEAWLAVETESGDLPPFPRGQEDAAVSKFRDDSVALLKDRMILSEQNRLDYWEIIDSTNMIVRKLPRDEDRRSLQRALAHPFEKITKRPLASREFTQILDYAFNYMGSSKLTPKAFEPPMDMCKKAGWTTARGNILPDFVQAIPCWESVLNRMDDGEAFAAFYWGIYTDHNPENRQVLWLDSREGETGKSTILEVLGEPFGVAKWGVPWPAIKNSHQFIIAEAMGKRFCYISDCKNSKLLLTETFQVLADRKGETTANKKYGDITTGQLEARWIIASNYRPYMVGESYNTTRTLWITINPFDAALDPDFATKLRKEMPGFLAYCFECYEKRCPDDYSILVNEAVKQKVLGKILEGQEGEFEDLFDKLFMEAKEAEMTRAVLNETLTEAGLSKDDADNFKEWLRKKNMGTRGTGKTYRNFRLRVAADNRSPVLERVAERAKVIR